MRPILFLAVFLLAAASGCRPAGEETSRGQDPVPSALTSEETSEIQESLLTLQTALEKRPDDPALLLDLGDTATKAGHYDNAEIAYMKAIALEPGNPESYNRLGIHYVKRRKTEAALSSFARALKIDPDNINAHYYLGNLALLSRELATATRHYTRVMELDPGHAYALEKLTMIRQAAASQQSMDPFEEQEDA